jgi:hypothetical protein
LPACWESQYREGASERKGFISQWQGIYHAPPAAPVEAIQKESAESLLRKLIEANDPKYGPVCYILAVMLERKRILKVKEQIKARAARFHLRTRRDGRHFHHCRSQSSTRPIGGSAARHRPTAGARIESAPECRYETASQRPAAHALKPAPAESLGANP